MVKKNVLKYILVLVVSAFMLCAGSALAMEKATPEEMDSVTGQAGVDIAPDDIKMYMNVEDMWYTDTDGLNGNDGASVGVKNLESIIQMNSIQSTGSATPTSPGTGVQGTYTGNKFTDFTFSPLSIDVGKLRALSYSYGLYFDMPTVELFMDQLKMNVGVNDSVDPLNSDSITSFGKIAIDEMALAVMNGWGEIRPHGDGVDLVVDDVEMYQNIQGLWYIDQDGLSGDDGASVGLTDMMMNLQINAFVYDSSGVIGSPGKAYDGHNDLPGLESSDADYIKANFDPVPVTPLAIDVSSALPDMSAINGEDTAGVHIRLGTVHNYISNFSSTLAVNDSTDPLNGGDKSEFGDIHMNGMTTMTFDGDLEIAPH